MKQDFIKTEQLGHVRRIVLNRPDVLNSFNRVMCVDLLDALQRAGTDESVRAIELSSEGRAFSAGQDVQELSGVECDLGQILVERFNPIIRAIRYTEKPVICGVHGIAAGAGASIALACDFVVATKHARFVQSFCKVGLIPDSGATFFLPRLVGIARATALSMLGDALDAEEALRWGLIYAVYPDESFAAELSALSKRLAAMPTRALGFAKRALNHALTSDLENQLELERDLQSLAGTTADYKEGVSSFLEKRPAKFLGR